MLPDTLMQPVSTPTQPATTPTQPATTPTQPATTPTQPASTQNHPTTTLTEAKIISTAGNGFMVAGTQGVSLARRAAGCLLMPAPGDKVLLYTGSPAYILQILERGEQPGVVDLPADCQLGTRQGGLHIHTATDLQLSAGERISQVSQSWQQYAQTAISTNDSITQHCQSASLSADRIQVRSRELQSFIERVSQHAKSVLRWVENSEIIHAGHWIQQVKHSLTSRANTSSITARRDIQIDAERIHMG
jgi:hypothetical protein